MIDHQAAKPVRGKGKIMDEQIYHFDFTDIVDGMGEPPILVHENKYCEDCRHEHEFEKCPKCGSWIGVGFGLMFGGYGPYKFCESDDCDWFFKTQCEE